MTRERKKKKALQKKRDPIQISGEKTRSNTYPNPNQSNLETETIKHNETGLSSEINQGRKGAWIQRGTTKFEDH